VGTSSPTGRLARLTRSTAVAVVAVILAALILPGPVAGRTYAPGVVAARDYARHRIGAEQFRCLDALWERESRWNPLAHNRTSGAHGIPQAFPGVKMARYGAGWRTDPLVQVKWGLAYVRSRYGTACRALDHAYLTGWY